jgi:hypothetical protein
MSHGRVWELRIVRESEQRRASDARGRTVGRYQVFHDGVRQTGTDLAGTTAEPAGPGANAPAGNGRRVAPGRYPLATWGGETYVTWGYAETDAPDILPRPGLALCETGDRTEILVHPGLGFLASVGCINLCAALPDATEQIPYPASRRRVIALIEDMKSLLGDAFPRANGSAIAGAFVVIEGEPA